MRGNEWRGEEEGWAAASVEVPKRKGIGRSTLRPTLSHDKKKKRKREGNWYGREGENRKRGGTTSKARLGLQCMTRIHST